MICCACCKALLDALHELAWALVLAGQGVEADQVTPSWMYLPLPGELLRRQLTLQAIAAIEAFS